MQAFVVLVELDVACMHRQRATYVQCLVYIILVCVLLEEEWSNSSSDEEP